MDQHFEPKFLEIGHKKIHYYAKTEGKPPLVFLHGGMDNGLCYGPIARLFLNKYDIYLPDVRGHGKTEVSEDDYSYERMVEDLYEFIIALNLTNVILVGHSMGASIATLFASTHPNLIKSVVLEDPGFGRLNFGRITRWLVKRIMKIVMSIFLRGDFEDLLKRGAKQNPKWSHEELKPWARSKVEFKEHGYKSLSGILDSKFDWERCIPRIKAKLFLLTAEGGMTKDETAEKIVEIAQEVEWIKIPDAKHNIRRENYKDYLRILKGILDP